jgi:hypothetical protein
MRCHAELSDSANIMSMTHTYVYCDNDIPVGVGFRMIWTRQCMSVQANDHTGIKASVSL